MRSRADLESIHRYSSRHRDLLARSDEAACFYCKARFNPKELQEWIDQPECENDDIDEGVTALCPRCGFDAVLPSAAPIHWDSTLLDEMNRCWVCARARMSASGAKRPAGRFGS